MKQKIFVLLALSFLIHYNPIWGQIIPSGVQLPDNIINADCHGTPPEMVWGISESTTHNRTVIPHTGAQVYVGDLDGDGAPELVTLGTDNIWDNSWAQTMYIYKGPDHTTVNTLTKRNVGFGFWGSGCVALLSAKLDGINDSPYIVALDGDGYLYAFDMNGTAISTWTNGKSDTRAVPAGTSILNYYADISIADFNNDGIPEICAGKYILNAITGKKICESPGRSGLVNAYGDGKRLKYSSIPADIDGDGILEYIAGNEVYKVDIASGSASGTMTLWKTIAVPATAIPNDGKTQVADIDMDGYLDVIVSATNLSVYGAYVWVWSPMKGEVLAWTGVGYARNQSMPFIGDIDGDGKPEILFITSWQATNVSYPAYDYIYAYKYDGTTTLKQFWKYSHSDRSGNTGITLFDFNQDNIMEIVYRDESHLRIIDGSLTKQSTPYNLHSVFCSSGTCLEYPVVADINGDGQAEIVVNGHPTSTVFPFANGPLRIFKAGTATKWAPARKVWNQYMYNAVNVNEDLTIPAVQLNPASVFPGDDGVLGTSDDVRPYNNFLQQQTMLNTNGTPIWLLPNAEIVDIPTFTYNEATDVMTVNLQVKNTGDARFEAPFYATIYKDNIGGSPSETLTYSNIIAPDETVSFTFTLTGWSPFNFLVIKVNDNGSGTNNQEVCRDDKSQYRYCGILPTEQEACKDNIGEFTCIFTLSGNDTYQWQYSINDLTWEDITGATGKTYKPAYQEPGIGYYRVVVTNEDDTETVESASVRVQSRPCIMPVNPNIHIFR